MSIGAHHSPTAKTDEWLTPPDILAPLGTFDLDPCSPINRPWPTASHHYTIEDNGLRLPWRGRVWCNPPYGTQTGIWLRKLREHGTGTALIFARTETEMFFEHIWRAPEATGILFLEGRLHFYNVKGERAKGNAGGPSCLIAYGSADSDILQNSGLPGQFIPLTLCQKQPSQPAAETTLFTHRTTSPPR